MTKRNSFLDVMMVDDNDDDILLVRQAFKSSNHFRVKTVANDGEEALEILFRKDGDRRRSPSIILLDVNLPKKDGFQVLKELKSDQRTRLIPVVILTTSTRDEDVNQASDLGASSVISKPSTQERLKEMVRSFDCYWGETVRLPHFRL